MSYAIIFVVLIIIYFLPLYFNTKIKRMGTDDILVISVNLLFFKIIKIEINYLDLLLKNGKGGLKYNVILRYIFPGFLNAKKYKELSYEEFVHMYKNALKVYKLFKKPFNYIMDKITIKQINIMLDIGIYDAALTALLTGFFYSFINLALSIISLNIKFQKVPQIIIKPHFGETKFDIDVNSIIGIRLGNIIIGGMKLLGGYINERSSNRRINENYDGEFERYGRC